MLILDDSASSLISLLPPLNAPQSPQVWPRADPRPDTQREDGMKKASPLKSVKKSMVSFMTACLSSARCEGGPGKPPPNAKDGGWRAPELAALWQRLHRSENLIGGGFLMHKAGKSLGANPTMHERTQTKPKGSWTGSRLKISNSYTTTHAETFRNPGTGTNQR